MRLSSSSIRATASGTVRVSRSIERGLRCSVGERSRPLSGDASACAPGAPGEAGARRGDGASASASCRRASSTAPHTPSASSPDTLAPGQAARIDAATRRANAGCLSSTLPASTNCTGAPALATRRAQATPSVASVSTVEASTAAAISSPASAARNTSSASPAMSDLLAAWAHVTRSWGSLSSSAARNRWPSAGHVPRRSPTRTIAVRARTVMS